MAMLTPVYLKNSDRVAKLYVYSDFITYQEILQDKDSLDNKGRFTLKLHTKITQPVLIKINNAVAKLYIEPSASGIKEYIIKMYPPDSVQVNVNDIILNAQISLLTYDTLELNSLIFDFNKIYNKYMEEATRKFINRNVLFKKLDSILVETSYQFKHTQNHYFKNYIDYTIAQLNINATRDKNTLANIFLIQKPVQINNYEYMEFFNSFFKDYLIADITKQKHQTIYYTVNKSTQIKQLFDFVKEDQLLNKNDTLKELVLIQNLYHFYFNDQFNPYAVQILLEQLLTSTRIEEHKKILQNIIQEFNQLKQGTNAPDFIGLTKDSSFFNLYSISKQHIYLNFFSLKSQNSLKELKDIQFLSDKFGNKVKFISVCIDDDFMSFKEFVRKNPQYKWLFLWNFNPANDLSAKVKYNVKATPLFFLINTDKTLMLSPAPAPSDGIYYQFQKMFGKKKNTNRLPE
ncbi:MAG: thioredoxin-like domain-containing protein [Bacteroidia bacterium]|nr:thioredoxin-like domain-containing protein [Bacteroidia bacterium]